MALQRSETRFKAFVENAADGFLIVGPQGEIQDVNQRACKMLGYSCEELLQCSVTDIDVATTQADLLKLKPHLDPEEPTIVESQHCRKDGSVFPVEVSICQFGTEE